jgi:hypothetical protein
MVFSGRTPLEKRAGNPTVLSPFSPKGRLKESGEQLSCPHKSAKRVFALDVAGIHVF